MCSYPKGLLRKGIREWYTGGLMGGLMSLGFLVNVRLRQKELIIQFPI
jgi:hypothetical protein